MKFVGGEMHAGGIRSVDDEDDGIGIARIVGPERTHLVQTANVPAVETKTVGCEDLMIDT